MGARRGERSGQTRARLCCEVRAPSSLSPLLSAGAPRGRSGWSGGRAGPVVGRCLPPPERQRGEEGARGGRSGSPCGGGADQVVDGFVSERIDDRRVLEGSRICREISWTRRRGLRRSRRWAFGRAAGVGAERWGVGTGGVGQGWAARCAPFLPLPSSLRRRSARAEWLERREGWPRSGAVPPPSGAPAGRGGCAWWKVWISLWRWRRSSGGWFRVGKDR